MKKWRSIAIMAGIAIVLAFALELIQINTWPRASVLTISEEKKQEEISFSPDDFSMIGYEKAENGYVVVTPDPQMYIDTWDVGNYSNVSFYFASPTTEELRVQIFYPENGDFSEACSVVTKLPIGTEYWNMIIPESNYSVLRIDIDGNWIPLSSIGISKEALYATELLPPKMHPIRLVVVTIALFVVFYWLTWCKVWGRLKSLFQNVYRNLRENRLKTILNVLAFPAGIGLSIFLFWIFCSVFGTKPMTMPRIVFSGFVGLFGTSMFVFRKTLKTQPEYIFLILMISLGFLYSYYVPHSGINGWDEDYHYTQALKTSYVDSIIMTPQDEATIVRTSPISWDLNGGIQEIYDKQDVLYHSGATENQTYPEPKGIPEVFNGIGLFIGRALGLRYYMIHFMGRFIGALAYAIIGFFAIRKLKSGKMIAAIALMIPTEVFIASSFNYDCYLTGFVALGLCYYIAQWQDREAKLSLKDAIIMIGSITFGCMTKQIYIPLLWILVLLPRDKFINRKHHVYFIISLVLATGFIGFTYVLPAMITGGGLAEGDMRGGSDISVSGQMEYIMQHPTEYIGVMWRYMTDEYFNFNRWGELLTNMAYHGIAPNQYIYLAIIVAVIFTDKNEYDNGLAHHPWAHIWPIIVSITTVLIVMTSMYLAFTPVGYSRVNGAQFRYIIPMFLPIMMHIGSGLVNNKMNRGWYNGLILSASAFVNFSCVYNIFISKYF